MAELRSWAAEWLTNLVKEGGAHGPGSRRTIEITNSTWSQIFSIDRINERIIEQQQPSKEGLARKSGRSAVTYEQPWQGQHALWIDAVQYQEGLPHQRVVLVQPYRKRMMGRTTPIGGVIDGPL